MNIFAHKTTISKEKAIYDIWYLKKTLEDIHPDLYFSKSEMFFVKELNYLIKTLPDNVCIDSLAYKLIPVIGRLNDGHTFVSWPKKDKNLSITYFPVKIDLESYKVMSSNNCSIPKGSTIISINNTNIKNLINQMLPFVDGEKEYYKKSVLEYYLPYYLWRVKGYQDDFLVTYIYKGEKYSDTIQGRSIDNSYDGVEGKFFISNVNNNLFGFLKLSAFGDTKAYFKLVNDCFNQMKEKGVNQLIIDLRDNSGGNTMLSDMIFQYVAKEKFKTYNSTLTKFSNTTTKFYRSYCLKRPYLFPVLITNPSFWKSSGTKESVNCVNELRLKEEDRFKGKVYLITSNYCYSTADDFARIFKKYQMGIIIGEETGGQRDSFGDTVFFKLPNSKISCGCSYKKFRGLDLGDFATDGVKPNYPLKCKNYSEEEILKEVIKINHYNDIN